MKLRFLFGFLLMSFCSLWATDSVRFCVIKNPYQFSTYFEFVGDDLYFGRVIKPSVRARTCYELYDSNGDYEGEGICRALSLGSLFSWAREIDLYDNGGYKIGMIDGKMLTTGRAKFNIYGLNDVYIGAAYLDQSSTSLILVDASSNERTLGHLKRSHLKDGVDMWEVILYDPQAIDVRILKFFSTFISDYENEF